MPPSAEKYAFRQPFKAVAQLSQKTGTLTKPVDPYVEATIDYAYKGYEVVKTKVEKVPKVSPYVLIALGLFASATISFFLIIPAVIFFPITIGLGILTSFAAIVLAPVAVVFGWILISSPPVQTKVVKPALDNLLKNDKVAELLLAKPK